MRWLRYGNGQFCAKGGTVVALPGVRDVIGAGWRLSRPATSSFEPDVAHERAACEPEDVKGRAATKWTP